MYFWFIFNNIVIDIYVRIHLAAMSVRTSLKPDPWAAFKRKAAFGSKQTVAKKSRKEVSSPAESRFKVKADPYVCLGCGSGTTTKSAIGHTNTQISHAIRPMQTRLFKKVINWQKSV